MYAIADIYYEMHEGNRMRHVCILSRHETLEAANEALLGLEDTYEGLICEVICIHDRERG
jgi:hypothetical protein